MIVETSGARRALVAGSDERHCPRRADGRPPSPTIRAAYHGPLIAIGADAARAAMLVERIRSRCPELTAANLLLVSRVITASERAKDGSPKKAAVKRAPPAKRRA